jgi:hypothetical protein
LLNPLYTTFWKKVEPKKHFWKKVEPKNTFGKRLSQKNTFKKCGKKTLLEKG